VVVVVVRELPLAVTAVMEFLAAVVVAQVKQVCKTTLAVMLVQV
jgi:hypothetical protein